MAGWRLKGKKLCSPSFCCYACSLSRYGVRTFIHQIPHNLPANGRVGI